VSRNGFELGTRGRVPFALVGVLLVVSSALFASAIDQPRPTPEPAVDLAVERTTADARAAFRTAVADASVDAAENPVLAPAPNEWGDVIDPDSAFRDALKIRIYLAARERIGSVARSHRGVTANATLPATPTPADLERAMARVRVEPAGPDKTQLRATISNVTVQATSNGRVVGTKQVSFSVIVDTPVLAVHERVEEFQSRLKAGVAKPGLGQKLTARLYAVAWARGYAQYGGAPIDNVVANRHVELVTNGAVLGVQESVFGQSDPDGRRALSTATATVGLKDVLSASSIDPGANALFKQQLDAAATPSEGAGLPGLTEGGTDAPPPNETVDVSVGRTADTVFREMVRWRGVNQTIDDVYTAEIRTLGESRRVSGGTPSRPGPPERPVDGWELWDESTETTVLGVSNATRGPGVSQPDGYHRFETYVRTVRLEHETRAIWIHNGTRNTTTNTRTETKRVTVTVVGRHAPSLFAPDRPIETVHERPGPLGGTNLADVPERVKREVVDGAGGPDGLAKRAALGSLNESDRTVEGEWSDAVFKWIYPGFIELRKTVGNTSVSLSRGKIGTHQVNPPAELADKLRERRAALVDAPETYHGVPGKARAAVRGAYLHLVIRQLERQAENRQQRANALSDALKDAGAPSLSKLQTSYDARRASERGTDTGIGTAGTLDMHVDGAPPYLSLTKVEEGDVASVEGEEAPTYPLTARNVNYFTVPHGDATDAILTALIPGGSSQKQRLDTAARALRAANRTLDHRPNATVEERRDRLRAKVDKSVGRVERDLVRELAWLNVGNDTEERERIVSETLSEWEPLDAQALALANGSVVEPLVAVAERRGTVDGWSTRERDWVRLSLKAQLYESLNEKRGKVSGPAVTAATATIKGAVKDRVEAEAKDAFQKQFNESIDQIPAGLPMAPPLGNWWVTTNVWSVTVRGQYARFAVETPRRTPGAGDASLNYVRDGENATLDVDGDGREEVLGRASKVTFTTRTAVVVVVPPGGTGVGDVDGVAIEESPGWAIPGPVDRTQPWTGEAYVLSADGTPDERCPGAGVGTAPRPRGGGRSASDGPPNGSRSDDGAERPPGAPRSPCGR